MEYKELFNYAWGALVPFMMFNHKRTQDKIDKVVENHVKREEFNGTISSLRNEIRDGNKDVTHRLDLLLQTLIEKK